MPDTSAVRRWRTAGLMLVLIALAALAIRYGPDFVALVSDRARVQAWLVGLGPLGPLVFILMNASQVVVAPIPGYVVQGVAGYLFGVWWGSVFGIIGMLLGGWIAMMLARLYGRPLVQRIAGAERLQRWEGVIHSDSIWPWFLLLLGPVGDIPYFLAGLTRVAAWKILLIALVLRAPSVLVAAAVGAGLITVPLPSLVALGIVFVLLAALLHRRRDSLQRWFDAVILRRLGNPEI